MSKQLLHREGFWYSEYEPMLPMPIANDHPWPGLALFADHLRRLEAKTHKVGYKGWSDCRLCGKRNGSTEFHSHGWMWPEGFRHYIEDHNVRPSLAFQEFVMGARLRDVTSAEIHEKLIQAGIKEIVEAEDKEFMRRVREHGKGRWDV